MDLRWNKASYKGLGEWSNEVNINNINGIIFDKHHQQMFYPHSDFMGNFSFSTSLVGGNKYQSSVKNEIKEIYLEYREK